MKSRNIAGVSMLAYSKGTVDGRLVASDRDDTSAEMLMMLPAIVRTVRLDHVWRLTCPQRAPQVAIRIRTRASAGDTIR